LDDLLDGLSPSNSPSIQESWLAKRVYHRCWQVLAAKAATLTPAYFVSRCDGYDSSLSLSNCRMGRFVSSIRQPNWYHGLAASSLLFSTQPRTHRPSG